MSNESALQIIDISTWLAMDNKKGSDTAVSTSPIRHPVGEAGCEDKREVKPAGEGPQEAAVRAVDIDDWEVGLFNSTSKVVR